MRYKILTTDDSKTVRIIVKKAFKGFDVDIFEAANGVEGLALAAKETPDLILLDITMPVMDGIEMLTKLKGDPQLKGIPVIMLTAEGGREQVLKIAKIGVRDYIVKPFKEEVLVEKAGRILDLKPLSEAGAKAKSIFDPADILVVEDKPVIIQQIQEGLKHTPWKIHGAATTGEAIDFCTRSQPDLMIVSLSLPEEAAFNLFRMMRTNIKTKYLPIFALSVKTASAEQQNAQQVGFSAIITKPIDFQELEAKMSKAMNLDTSLRYFDIDTDYFMMKLPENCTQLTINEFTNYLKPKVAEAVDNGLSKAIIDLHLLRSLDMGVIKTLLTTMQTCRELALQYVLVGNPQIVQECKNLEDTRSWTFCGSIEEARASFGKAAAPQPVGA